jgi:hypothetical protein
MTVIKARDFNPSVSDPFRDDWTEESMSAVVEALKGAKVHVEVNKQYGTTHEGVLVRVTPAHGGFPGVLFRGDHGPDTLFPLYKIGIILDPSGDAKWHAMDIYRENKRARA